MALDLHGTRSPYANAALLRAQLQRLGGVLPGVNVCALVLQDLDALATDAGSAAQRLIAISCALGGADLCQIISRNPSLLYGEVRGWTG